MAKQLTSKKKWPTNVWVVIPGYNEAKYVTQVLKKVSNYTNNVIFVDDGSSDNTVTLAKAHTQHVLSHITNLGKGAALKTGCEYAFNSLDAEAVVFMDSDDQHDPQELWLFVEKLREGYEMVFGVRPLNTAMPVIRRLANASISLVIWALFGKYIADIPSGYKALSKKAYSVLQWQASDYAVEMEIAARVAKEKVHYTEIMVTTIYHDLDRGMTFLDAFKIIWQLVAWRFIL